MKNKDTMQKTCNELAHKMNGKCVSEYENTKTKLEWECSNGHRFWSLISNVRLGHWCPFCAGLKRKTIEDCIDLAEQHSGKCLSIGYLNSRSDLEWECQKGHRFFKTFSTVQQGSWCPYCAGVAKKTLGDCNNLAKKIKGKCLAKEYKNSVTKMEWECEFGHKWFATFSSINAAKTWCPYCAGLVKKTIEDCHNIANKRGGKCLSEKYINNRSKLKWQCKNGHIFFSDFNHVSDNNRWCPNCAGQTKHTIKDAHVLAESLRGKCISKEYTNSKTKLEWECCNGHTFFSDWNHVGQGKWCPKCKRSRAQSKLSKIIGEIFSDYTIFDNYKGFKWLVGKNNHPMEIDIFVADIALSIEYDGEQHFMPICFGTNSKKKINFKIAFADCKKRDKRKNMLIKQHKSDVKFFIRFDYRQKITKEFVIDELIKLGVKI